MIKPLRTRVVYIEDQGCITVQWSKWWWTAYMRVKDFFHA